MDLEVRGDDPSLSLGYRLKEEDDWSSLLEPIDSALLSEQVAGGFTGVCIGVHAWIVPVGR